MTLLRTLKDSVAVGTDWLSLQRTRANGDSGRARGRHLALFAWALPPHSGAGVYRPLSFMRYAARIGWRIDAFCSEPLAEQRRHGDELLSRVPREVTLHPVARSTREPSFRFFPHVDGGFTNAIAFARSASSLLAHDPPDVVLASGPPFNMFVSALLVAQRFGAPLVLDYRDEWSECPFDFVNKDGDDREWERRCLAAADAVLFTTASHLRHQLATFPELAPAKAHLVPNGWEPDDFAARPDSSTAVASARTPTLRIAHVGNLAGHTPPHDFLESLRALLTSHPDLAQRIAVQFIGRRSPSAETAIREFEFPGVIEMIDHVGKRDAARLMQESDVLLLIAAPGLERYLPGKLFDYLAARRPVLVFGTKGEASELVERLGAGIFWPAAPGASLEDAFERLSALDMSDNAAAVDAWLDAHRREELAKRAFDIIESVRR
jgi:glycosyltransferase involved in cell wall biosynthesis